LIVNVADVDPAGTVTAVGTEATFELDDMVTSAPALGARGERITVPVSEVPPVMEFEERLIPVSCGTVADGFSNTGTLVMAPPGVARIPSALICPPAGVSSSSVPRSLTA
jgi:hypothetical protein